MNFGNVLLLIAAGLLALIMWLANMADRRRERRAEVVASQPNPAGGPAVVENVASEGFQPAGPDALPAQPSAGVYEMAGAPAATLRQPTDDTGTLLAAVAYTLLVVTYLGLIGIGLVLQLVGFLASGPMSAEFGQNLNQSGLNPEMLTLFSSLGASVWVPSVLGILLLIRPVRRLISHAISIDPQRTVHAIALSYIAFILINLFSSVVMLPDLSKMLSSQNVSSADLVTIPMIWIQEIYLAVLAVIGVGWLSRRRLGKAFDRLALVVPTGGQVLVGIGAGLVLVAFSAGVQLLAAALNIAQDVNVQRVSEALIGPLTQSLFGVITLGVAAALGEEALFRGALQPRFGLVLTTILFALMHGQYGFSLSTLVVLVVGFAVGIIRQRSNTSTTMIVHAVYNSTLGMLALLNIMK